MNDFCSNRAIAITNIAVNTGFIVLGSAITWVSSSISNKIIEDNCKTWIKPYNSTTSTKEWLEEASKEEVCKWAPFISDFTIGAVFGQVTGMIVFGIDFRIWKPKNIAFAKGGMSFLIESFKDFSSNDHDLNNDIGVVGTESNPYTT